MNPSLRTALLCISSVLLLASPAATQRPRARQPAPERPPGPASRSVNYPWDGQLLHGVRLRESRYVRYLPEYAPGGRFYGTSQLVQLIERAAQRVSSRLPGAKLSVGELSSPRGGDVDGHRSHESGRDADIGFFTTGSNGRPYKGAAFAPFDALGRGLAPHASLRFDDARNWELVAGLVSDRNASVQYIFVSREIRARLLREGMRRQADAALLNRAHTVLVEPARGNPHRSHFHVRIYCPPVDRPQCRDAGPFWAWYPGTSPRPARSAHALAPRELQGSAAIALLPETREPHTTTD